MRTITVVIALSSAVLLGAVASAEEGGGTFRPSRRVLTHEGVVRQSYTRSFGVPRIPSEEDVLAFYGRRAPWAVAAYARVRAADPDRAVAALARMRRWMALYRRAYDRSPQADALMLELLALEGRRHEAIARFFARPYEQRLGEMRDAFAAMADVESRLDAVLLKAEAPEVADVARRVAVYRARRAGLIDHAITDILALPRRAVQSASLPQPDADYAYYDERYFDRTHFVAAVGLNFFLEPLYGYDALAWRADQAPKPAPDAGNLYLLWGFRPDVLSRDLGRTVREQPPLIDTNEPRATIDGSMRPSTIDDPHLRTE